MTIDGCVCLIDGVGRPRLLQLPDPKPRETIRYAHEGITKGRPVTVNFDCSGERDPDGRVIYRQRMAGALPDPRWAYLTRSSIGGAA